jgi:hypothetical protein
LNEVISRYRAKIADVVVNVNVNVVVNVNVAGPVAVAVHVHGNATVDVIESFKGLPGARRARVR